MAIAPSRELRSPVVALPDCSESMSILQQARFFTTVAELEQLPMLGLPELAFAGRSNAGKSSAINALCHQKRLAFASKTPGRTQHLNYFAIGRHVEDDDLPAAFLVDLPGYGFADASHSVKAHWGDQLGHYLQRRDVLVGLVLIMDARHPMGPLDVALMDWFGPTGKPVHALLTKCDKLNHGQAQSALAGVKRALHDHSSQHTCALFSSLKGTGVDAAEERVLEMLGWSASLLSRGPRNARTKKAPTQGE